MYYLLFTVVKYAFSDMKYHTTIDSILFAQFLTVANDSLTVAIQVP